MRAYLFPMMFVIATGMAGCNSSDRYDTITNYLSVHAGNVAVHAPGRGDADITAAGDLSIAGNNVAVNDAQRDLLKHYYMTAQAIRDHGIATGEAGAAVAGKALGSVASGLASGDTSKIDSEVNASAAKVEAQAALICNDLADLRSTQETLASQLPAFQPYALIKANEADDCRGRKISRE
ncbi:hypothetical protein [Rhodanobacter umsongensis]